MRGGKLYSTPFIDTPGKPEEMGSYRQRPWWQRSADEEGERQRAAGIAQRRRPAAQEVALGGGGEGR